MRNERSTEAQALWAGVIREHPDVLDKPAALGHLQAACEAQDQVRAAQRRIDIDGQIIANQHGEPRAHPALRALLRANRQLLASLAALRANWVPARPQRRSRSDRADVCTPNCFSGGGH
jgi:phage terminase small subunit